MRGVALLLVVAAAWILVWGVPKRVARDRFTMPSRGSIAASLGIGLAAAVVSIALLNVASVALSIGLLAACVPAGISVRRREAAAAQIRERWPDVLMYTRTAIGAGATIEDAVLDAMEKVGSPFSEMADEVSREVLFGRGFAEAMVALRDDQRDPTTDRVVATLATASRTGGSRVGDTIAALATSISDELRLRKAHDAALTEQRWTVNVALVAPWVLLSLTIATNPQAQSAFSSAEGAVVVAIGLCATLSGWVLARRTAKLSRVPGVFR